MCAIIARAPSVQCARDLSQKDEDVDGGMTGVHPKGRIVLAAAALILAVHLALVVSSFWNKSATFDETIHLAGGYAFWTRNDYRLVADTAIVPDRLAALPLLFMGLSFVPESSPEWINADFIAVGRKFLYESGNNPVWALRAARLSMAVFGLFAGILIFVWSKRLFGPWGGLLSLALFAFSPAMIAHGGLVTTDRTSSFFFLLSMFMLGKIAYRLSWANLLFSGAALGGLLASKASGSLIIPMGTLWAAIRLLDPKSLAFSLFGPAREIRGRAAIAASLAGAAVALALLAGLVVWGAYGFRYSTFSTPENDPARPVFLWDAELSKVSPAPRAAIEFARDRKLLPETFLYMYAYVLGNADDRSAFLAGNYSVTGWPWFFPFCFAVKNPVALFLLLAVAIAGLMKRFPRFFALAPLLILFGFYWAVALFTHLNIGERHIMPTYLPMFVLAGASAVFIKDNRRRIMVLLAAYAVESVSVWPHYLAFFNRAAGGPENGHNLLVDSSLDWGQDLPELANWLFERNFNDAPSNPVYLSYFGTALPWYHGIKARLLPSYASLYDERMREPEPFQPGVYCVSATQLVQMYQGLMGHWCLDFENEYQRLLPLVRAFWETSGGAGEREKWYAEHGGRESVSREFALFEKLRMARLCAWLRKNAAHGSVGHSIFIYRLGTKELDEALYGPPAELHADRGVKGLVLPPQGNH